VRRRGVEYREPVIAEPSLLGLRPKWALALRIGLGIHEELHTILRIVMNSIVPKIHGHDGVFSKIFYVKFLHTNSF